MDSEVLFRLAYQNDVKGISEMHKKVFKNDHFTALFSSSMLQEYIAILINLNRFSVVARKGEQLIGYLIAGDNLDKALQIFIKKNRLKILVILVTHPKFLMEKISEVFIKIIAKKRKSIFLLRLFLIAVNPENRKNQIGTKLLEYFENKLRESNIFTYGLSVRKNNKKAIIFYKQNGFIFEFEDSKAFYYYKNLSKSLVK